MHRDIKPANLLVDGRGNLWITDFGLARCQSQAGLTMTGDLVGTLRYMSPEQALAKRVVVDHRTDVYSLGATFYELLTLEPAFGGRDREEFLRQIAFEEPMPPRRRNKAVPVELETIVLKALEKNPADRYATAQELADDLERFLKDEPIRAQRPSLAQRARKWARRHQPVVWSGAAALLAIVAVIAGSVGWMARDQSLRRIETERAVTAALDEAAKWQQEGRIPEALAAARRADWLAGTGGAGEALRRRVVARRADLELVADLEEARIEVMAGPKDGSFDNGLAVRLYAEAFQRAGLDVETLPEEEAAQRIGGSSVAVELAAMLDHWALFRRVTWGQDDPSSKHLLRVARAADPDSWRDRLRDAQARWVDRQALITLAESAEVLQQPPLALSFLGVILRDLGAVAPAEALLRQARQQHPGDFWANLHLAVSLEKARPPRWDEAIRFLTAAVAVRPQSHAAHDALGTALAEKGSLDEAIAEFREAIRLKEDFGPARNNLGLALQRKNRLDDAIVQFREAVRINKNDATAHSNLGVALKAKGLLDEAIAEYQKAIRIKNDFPEAHTNLGNALLDKGQLDEAISQYRQALATKQDFQQAYNAHNGLGIAMTRKGRLGEAIVAINEAIRLRPGFASAHNNLGWVLQKQGRLDEAIARYKEALRLEPDLEAAQENLHAVAWHFVACPDSKAREPKQGVELAKQVVDLSPKRGNFWNTLGVARYRVGQWPEAIAALEKSMELRQGGSCVDWFFLAMAHWQLGDKEEARKRYSQAVEWMEKNQPQNEELRRFRAEAEELLGMKNK